MSKQLLRSGTSFGANVHEGKNAQSRPDFVSKTNIALKEATGTACWISLPEKAEYINQEDSDSLANDCNRIIAVLIKGVKAAKSSQAISVLLVVGFISQAVCNLREVIIKFNVQKSKFKVKYKWKVIL